MDRLLSHTQQVNNQEIKRLLKNKYDALGQLESKIIGKSKKRTEYIDITDNLSIEGNTITKTGATGWDGALATAESITEDGYVEYSVNTCLLYTSPSPRDA